MLKEIYQKIEQIAGLLHLHFRKSSFPMPGYWGEELTHRQKASAAGCRDEGQSRSKRADQDIDENLAMAGAQISPSHPEMVVMSEEEEGKQAQGFVTTRGRDDVQETIEHGWVTIQESTSLVRNVSLTLRSQGLTKKQ